MKDCTGNPYMVPNTAFDVGMLDLTHPKTGTWFKQILGEMADDGVRGWMADFGEGLPVDAVLYSGSDSHIFVCPKNLFSLQHSDLLHEFFLMPADRKPQKEKWVMLKYEVSSSIDCKSYHNFYHLDTFFSF